MEIGKTIWFKSRKDFRKWLQKNNNRKEYLWLGFYKRHIKKTGILYPEAVEEALCFGWIDGILKRIDDQKHVIRFSPRRPKSVWSPHNINRVKKLIKQKKMRKASRQIIPQPILKKLEK
ncbi:MAG: hypothetical protein COT24_00480 [Candidatus Kerfeldbacteria bacterium CG08_land_8_20_14_0_20_40_16]|uniref:Bacteriocin-protection protein n=1 Tax=Candidatus Kerfeldbacteria bacterium CG08_land_8_20_14_0_20_40_16 TaxID=2014244 RepID=A0A2H0YWX9_9BACT|nr:MAG: hypothetical protein COT24_00480 [Candidatus Kerfeldbacteria bacterium CG08_land_8_20_14_0_20_40_16]